MVDFSHVLAVPAKGLGHLIVAGVGIDLRFDESTDLAQNLRRALHAPALIAGDDHVDVDVVAAGGLHLLDVKAQSAVAGDEVDITVWVGELRSDGVGDARAQVPKLGGVQIAVGFVNGVVVGAPQAGVAAILRHDGVAGKEVPHKY